eukprot:123867-Amphidinium_carterae.1
MFAEVSATADVHWTTSTAQGAVPIADLSQHQYPAFYHEGATDETEAICLGAAWPGEECQEQEVTRSSVYMLSSEQLATNSTTPLAASAVANASSVQVASLSVPLHGQVTLQLPAELARYVTGIQLQAQQPTTAPESA